MSLYFKGLIINQGLLGWLQIIKANPYDKSVKRAKKKLADVSKTSIPRDIYMTSISKMNYFRNLEGLSSKGRPMDFL